MKLTIVCLFICLISLQGLAQDSTSQSPGYKKFEEEYKRYRDSADKYALVPAVSMALIQNREIEINLFNSLLTANTFSGVKFPFFPVLKCSETLFLNSGRPENGP